MKTLFKNFLLIALFVSVLSGCNQDCIEGSGPEVSRTFELAPFHSFTLNGSGKVYLKQGETQNVEVRGQANILDLIEKDVKNGDWYITLSECTRWHEKLTFYITIPDIKNVRLNGSGNITTENTLEVGDINFDINGSGKINAVVIANSAKFKVNGSGDIDMEGEADNLTLQITGSGKYNGFNFPVKSANINISGSGAGKVNVAETLTVKISGSGDVIYKGSPQIDSSISGSGKVRKED